ncbi:MAG: tetraacyldisaccharide 4'-kinase [Fibrobacter sp.]|nr:tetraacyldisaccharide 4'-kinase [Fibrobacter sp.]
MTRIFYLPLALCYRAIYVLHHHLFLRPQPPLKHSKLVIVGSYRTGGAGKTPFCLWLSKSIADKGISVALLCHKYAYDEIFFLKQELQKFGNVQVIGTTNRHKTSVLLDRQGVDYIICDDGFEDTRLAARQTLLLLWEEEPKHIVDLWPFRQNRSLTKDHNRTKTTKLWCFGANPDVSFFIESATNAQGVPAPSQVNVFCGIADPERFASDLESAGYSIKGKVFLRDHCRNFERKLRLALAKAPTDCFVITQKDAIRLSPKTLQNDRVYVARQAIKVKKSVLPL